MNLAIRIMLLFHRIFSLHHYIEKGRCRIDYIGYGEIRDSGVLIEYQCEICKSTKLKEIGSRVAIRNDSSYRRIMR